MVICEVDKDRWLCVEMLDVELQSRWLYVKQARVDGYIWRYNRFFLSDVSFSRG